mmetsp:Transcript_92950/g.262772  ORF Transcript_92950/g.262772 Transcript_92950/m.262772 type:complete len:693 (+) Transcript_92950:145-2223(+)
MRARLHITRLLLAGLLPAHGVAWVPYGHGRHQHLGVRVEVGGGANTLLRRSNASKWPSAHQGSKVCSHYGGEGHNSHQAPFIMKERSGTGTTQLSRDAPSISDPGGTGLCIFPTATCASDFWCCSAAPWVKTGSNRSGSLMVFIGTGLLSLFIFIVTGGRLGKPWGFRASEAPGKAPGPEDALQEEVKRIENLKLEGSNFGLYLGLFVSILAAVFMSLSTQKLLRMTERNAMLAADAFLIPFGDIFQFLEDAVSVKIGYAIGCGDKEAIALILSMGVRGGALLGLVAACITTVLAFWPAVIRALLTPDLIAHSVSGCSLMPTVQEIVLDSRAFWLLRSWSWPVAFASMAYTGLLMGTRRFQPLCLAMALSSISKVAIWMIFVENTSERLSLLGWASFASTVVYFGVCAAAVWMRPPLPKEGAEERQERQAEPFGRSSSSANLSGESCRQGLQAMALEVCVQFGMSFGIYMAGSMGMGPLYQVSAMQSAMPLYGIAFSTCLGYAGKLIGSVLIGRQCFHMFRGFVGVVTFWSCAFALLAILATLPFRSQLAFQYGAHACIYATEPACAPVYASIFGQGKRMNGSLQDSFYAFTLAVAAMSLFNSMKCVLYGCFDFQFMAKAGVATLLFIYVPLICIARFAIESTKALYLAMYVPVIALAVIFLLRIRLLTDRMVRGLPGPWAQHADAGIAKAC